MNYLLIFFLFFALTLTFLREWFIKKRPTPSKIKQLQQEASQSIALGEWKVAKKKLNPLIEKRLGYPETLLIYLQLLHSLKLYDKAITLIEEEQELFSKELKLYQLKGKILLDLELPNAALEAFQHCLHLLKSGENQLIYLKALIYSGETEKAWKIIEPLLEENPELPLQVLAGDCQYKEKNYMQAILYYTEAQESGLEDPKALYKLADSLNQLEQYSKAETIFLNLLDKEPSNIDVILSLGFCYEAQNLYQKALNLYQKESSWNLGNPQIIRQSGLCAIYLKEYRYAEHYFQEVLKRGQVSAQNLAFLGYALECQYRWHDAELIYKHMIKEFPTNVSGYRALAWLYGVGLSKNISAELGLELAQRALELQSDPTTWEILSACEARAGNFSKAHTIQEQLSSETKDIHLRRQRRQNMRSLRKKIPLNETQIHRALVA